MGAIYLRYPDGQQTQRSEEETRRLWGEGLMPRDTIYWQKGMTQWRPVTEWLGIQPDALNSAAETVAAIRSYDFLIDPTGLTKYLQRLLWVSVVVGSVAFIFDLQELVHAVAGKMGPEQVAADDPVQSAIGLVQAGIDIVTGIVFLKWVYRAYKNTQGFGAEGLRFSPGWAVGYYFVPFLSLVRPVQVMSEIWRVSCDPLDWLKRRSSWLVGTWWTLFLLCSITTQISFELALDSSTANQWWMAAILAILGDFFSIPLSIVSLRLVTEIYRQQKNLVAAGE
jgi:hypothetical protein